MVTRQGALGIAICSTAFAALGRAQLKALAAEGYPLLIIPHPFGGRALDEVVAIAEALVGQIAQVACAPVTSGPAAAQAAVALEAGGRCALVEMPQDAWDFHVEAAARRWSDGLPVIAPTAERVDRMLGAMGAMAGQSAHVVASLAPGFGAATVERIAVNAVMAGCLPAHLPLLLAAVDAVADPAFNLQAVQSTTNPVTTWLIVNGPLAAELGMNAGINCLGQGNLANATLGRALRLVLQNIGGAWPGEMDRATHGQPGKFLLCCAEDEAASPWLPLHAARGLSSEHSAVTVVGASGTLNINTHAKDADALIACIAGSMMFPGSNDYHYCGEPWLILSPEHAAVFARAGLDRAAVQQRLWARSAMRAGDFAAPDFERTVSMRGAEFPDLSASTLIPPCRVPTDIGIVVAGGAGTHSVYVPTFGETRAVTRRVEV